MSHAAIRILAPWDSPCHAHRQNRSTLLSYWTIVRWSESYLVETIPSCMPRQPQWRSTQPFLQTPVFLRVVAAGAWNTVRRWPRRAWSGPAPWPAATQCATCGARQRCGAGVAILAAALLARIVRTAVHVPRVLALTAMLLASNVRSLLRRTTPRAHTLHVSMQ